MDYPVRERLWDLSDSIAEEMEFSRAQHEKCLSEGNKRAADRWAERYIAYRDSLDRLQEVLKEMEE